MYVPGGIGAVPGYPTPVFSSRRTAYRRAASWEVHRNHPRTTSLILQSLWAVHWQTIHNKGKSI